MVFLTDSVQDLRTVETLLREKYGMPEAGESELSGEEHAKQLLNFVMRLHEYANVLADRTTGFDRAFESRFNRGWIKTANRLNWINGRRDLLQTEGREKRDGCGTGW